MCTKGAPEKPKLRGFIHAFAFVCTAVSSVFFIASSVFLRFNLGIFIYLLSQLLQYGISASYHIPTWTPRIRRILQHLDHMCIFVLISGTQTSVLISLVDIRKSAVARLVIKMSWSITLVGILKTIVMNRFYRILDVALYIAHGLVILPFYRVLSDTSAVDKVLVGAGAVLYIAGGAVYGLGRPNPFPSLFGYHEVFHVFTIAANMCYATIITRKYILSVFLQHPGSTRKLFI